MGAGSIVNDVQAVEDFTVHLVANLFLRNVSVTRTRLERHTYGRAFCRLCVTQKAASNLATIGNSGVRGLSGP